MFSAYRVRPPLLESSMSSFYLKNVPPLERTIRIFVGVSVAIGAIFYLSGWAGWLVAAISPICSIQPPMKAIA